MPRAFDPLHSDRPLIAYVDFKSPYAFVAVQPTYELAEAVGISVDWRPLTLDIPSFGGSARLDRDDRVVESQRIAFQWTGIPRRAHAPGSVVKAQGGAAIQVGPR